MEFASENEIKGAVKKKRKKKFIVEGIFYNSIHQWEILKGLYYQNKLYLANLLLI